MQDLRPRISAIISRRNLRTSHLGPRPRTGAPPVDDDLEVKFSHARDERCPVSASVRTEKVGSSTASCDNGLRQQLLLGLGTGLNGNEHVGRGKSIIPAQWAPAHRTRCPPWSSCASPRPRRCFRKRHGGFLRDDWRAMRSSRPTRSRLPLVALNTVRPLPHARVDPKIGQRLGDHVTHDLEDQRRKRLFVRGGAQTGNPVGRVPGHWRHVGW